MTKADLKTLSYTLRHKWFVLYAGVRYTKTPLWRLVIHDASKFKRDEWVAYRDFFYGERTPAVKQAFADAFRLHVSRNDHHWNFWLDEKNPRYDPREMPEAAMKEMVADWMGAGRAITGKWEVHEWYAANAHRQTMHSTTRRQVEALLDSIK